MKKTTMFKRLGATLTVSALLMGGLMGCSSTGNESVEAPSASASADAAYPMTYNYGGREVAFDKAPEKILTSGPTSAIYAAELAEQGQFAYRSGEFKDPNPEADAMGAKILSDGELSTESIISQDVDLVITDTFTGFDPKKVEEAGIKVIVPNSIVVHAKADGADSLQVPDESPFELISSDLRELGKVMGQPKRGEEKAAEFEKKLAQFDKEKPGKGKTAALLFYFSPEYPVMSVSNASIEGQMMERLGLENIFADEKAPYVEEVNWETILEKDPDVIIIKYGRTGSTFEEDKARLLTEPGADTMKAVKNDKIVGISNHNIWPTPAIIPAMQAISDSLK
ncbi:ABC transporter substrate-binding protein [Gordonibacter sp. Marseille-P4307]|uniref:ABC transporter substrate-binding protein n=1 Tax=Gordonibacter sp. Marseille-P4307 TaxID=2161815 RepID=UPI0019D1467E|nr:ABC transporter substrate-binding protein [Gordonibacter sp. Marseille-P4307]